MKFIFICTLVANTAFYSHQALAEIETISITSTRQESSLESLTRNISVVSREDIATVQGEHVNQALSRVAGAWISRGNGQEHLTAIRSPVLTGAGGCGAFFIAQDGIGVRAPGFCNANQLFDLNTEQAQQIEVLKGPASVLYGSNAVHGVINFITPTPEQLSPLSIAFEQGPHDFYRGSVSLSNGSRAESKLGSFALYGNATSDGGYKQDSGYDQQKLNMLHHYISDNFVVKTVFAASNLNQETSGFVQGTLAYEDPALKTANPNPEAYRDSQSARLYSQISYMPARGGKIRLTPYLRWSDMTFLQHYLPWQATEQNDQRSIGLQAQYEQNFNAITLISGLDMDYTSGGLREFQAEPFSDSVPAGEHYDYEVDATVLSPFFSADWQATDRIKFNLGARYEHTEYQYDNRLSDGSACAADVTNCRFTRPVDQTVSYSQWSYQAGVNFQLSPSHNLYGQASQGYRAPQTSELFRLQSGQQVANLKAETLTGVELGWRGVLSDVRFDITAFSMEKDNFIFQDTQRQNISNGETSHHGLEASVTVDLSKNWYVAANGTLAKHRYENNLTLTTTEIKNNEIDTAPEHLASAQIGWRNDQGSYAELDWVHQGNYFLNPENTASYKGHRLLNFRAGLALNQQFSVGLRIINLTDVDYAERADFAFGNYRYFVGEPRSAYVTLRYQM